MQRQRQRAAGFTLIEALVVMSIIGLVAAVSIPSLQRARMRASMLEVVRTFEQAAAVSRITAIRRGRNVCLEILADDTRQQLNSFRAWIDANEDEVENAGEEVVGEWQIRRADEWSFEDSGTDPMYVLNAGGGGTARGVVYEPTGMALTEAAGQVGIGEGAFEFFVWYDARKWNTFRIGIFGGAGTVRVGMWDYENGRFDFNNFAYWEYY